MADTYNTLLDLKHMVKSRDTGEPINIHNNYHGKFRMVVLSIDINAASSGKLLFTAASN